MQQDAAGILQGLVLHPVLIESLVTSQRESKSLPSCETEKVRREIQKGSSEIPINLYQTGKSAS